ncbi:MAG: hypothetical protein HKN45_04310 [Flavobacteriales bacterium]|nr:hypothetical protein [Flavobacteriales bacterium]
MNDAIKNGYINWIDGMKISKDHFIDMQRAIEDRVRDARSVGTSSVDFGLIPGKLNGKSSLEYNILIEQGNRIVVELYQCRAISPAGDRVEIVSSLNSHSVALKKDFEIDSSFQDDRTYDIIVKVNSFDLSPYGDPDVEESPPRHPYAQPAYDLEIAPSDEIKLNEHNRNYVIIARIGSQRGEVKEVKEFIPPSMTMESAPELEEFFFKYHKFLIDLEQHLFRIVIKLNGAQQKTQLASNVDLMGRRLLDVIEREVDSVALICRRSSPLFLVRQAMSMARTVRHTTELMTNLGKDEFLNYIQEIIDMSPGEYMNVHTELCNLEYDPYNLHESLSKILAFCQVNSKLFDEWSRLDYIGKKKNTDIYVAEKPMDTRSDAPKPKGKWDF